MLFWYMLFVLPVVCRLLRRCWLPSHKNFAALKKFGVCDNKHFDFDLTFSISIPDLISLQSPLTSTHA